MFHFPIGHLRQRYLWGPAADQILAEEAVDGGTDDLVQWMLTDHLNTVRDIAKYDPGTEMTTVLNHLVYDAFGRVTSESNPAVDSLIPPRRAKSTPTNPPGSPKAVLGGRGHADVANLRKGIGFPVHQ